MTEELRENLRSAESFLGTAKFLDHTLGKCVIAESP